VSGSLARQPALNPFGFYPPQPEEHREAAGDSPLSVQVLGAAHFNIEEVARRMGLLDARIKALHRQREVHRIQVVKVMAPKCEAAAGNRACQ